MAAQASEEFKKIYEKLYEQAMGQGFIPVSMPDPVPPKETWHMSDGTLLKNVHPKGTCKGEFCVIHKPSDHSMRKWKLYRENGKFYRICPHKQMHFDVDEATFLGYWEHYCACKCCYGRYPGVPM